MWGNSKCMNEHYQVNTFKKLTHWHWNYGPLQFCNHCSLRKSILYTSHNSSNIFFAVFPCFARSQSTFVCKPLRAKCFYIMDMSQNDSNAAGFLYHWIPLSAGVWGFSSCRGEQQAQGCWVNAIYWRSCMLILSVRYYSLNTGNLWTKSIDCSAAHVNFKWAARCLET